MIWLGLAVYQTDINCRAYKNCRQSQIFFKKNVAKLLTTKEIPFLTIFCLTHHSTCVMIQATNGYKICLDLQITSRLSI